MVKKKGRIIFTNPSSARKAVNKLRAGANRPVLGHKVQVRLMALNARIGRLIVRNLAFDCSRDELELSFRDHGEIKEVFFIL